MILIFIFGGGVFFLTWAAADIFSYLYTLKIKPQIDRKKYELEAVRDYKQHRKMVAVEWKKKNTVLEVEVEEVGTGRTWTVENKGDFINYEAVEVSTKVAKYEARQRG